MVVAALDGPAADVRTAAHAYIAPGDHPGRVIQRVLSIAREELDTEVCFVAEFTGGRRVFRYVNGEVASFSLEVDGGDPLDDTYCQRIVDGRIEPVVADTRRHAATRTLPVTAQQGVGSHIGVPIVLSDGRIFGTLCGMGHSPDHELGIREVMFLRGAAALAADQLEQDELVGEDREEARVRSRRVLEAGGPTMVFQPILELATMEVVGVEALARFEAEPVRPPDVWFDEAWSVGCGRELELSALGNALAALEDVPDGVFLSVNLSPETMLDDDYLEILAATDAARVVLEITEHSRIFNYGQLRRSIAQARQLGAHLCVDDLGAGFSGLRDLVELAPDVLKLDRSLVAGIDSDRLRRIVTQALASAGHLIRATVVAEGIETPVQLRTLRTLGVTAGQGFLLARPSPTPPASRQLA